MVAVCDDLRIGGVLAASGIAGGLSINNTAFHVFDWSGVFGHVGSSLAPAEVSGRPGAFLTGDGLGRPRILNLNMEINRLNATGGLTLPTGAEQLWANTDTFLTQLVSGGYLEIDLPDTTKRFLLVKSFDPASIAQPRINRRLSPVLFSTWPYWKLGGNESTDTISGADTLVIAGLVSVYDAVLVFAGDGTFTNSTNGWSLTITGSTGAVTVDLGNRTVMQAGIPADQLLTRTDRDWGWFTVGSNSVTSSASVVVTWRNQFP